MDGEERPWGRYDILLDSDTCKVKKITVMPGQRLSYQLHHRRSEHWYVVEGEGVVTLSGSEINLPAGKAVDIPKKSAHRMANRGDRPLVFVEVQTGDYFGEDDIVRLEDDYDRVEE